jgi:putative transposase
VFFVTTTVRNHERLFSNPEKQTALREILRFCVKKHRACLYGYVLMPNHLHLLLRLEGGGPQLSDFMRDLKSYSSKSVFPDLQGMWERRFDDVAIISEDQFHVKLSYIHDNPVRAGLVSTPGGYAFSSTQCWLSGVSDGLVTIDLNT